MTDPSVVQKRLICIAHKSSKIGEQCSLYQQNSPAMPENPAAFWREELKTGYFNLPHRFRCRIMSNVTA
jgi:hypothetical protein